MVIWVFEQSWEKWMWMWSSAWPDTNTEVHDIKTISHIERSYMLYHIPGQECTVACGEVFNKKTLTVIPVWVRHDAFPLEITHCNFRGIWLCTGRNRNHTTHSVWKLYTSTKATGTPYNVRGLQLNHKSLEISLRQFPKTSTAKLQLPTQLKNQPHNNKYRYRRDSILFFTNSMDHFLTAIFTVYMLYYIL